MQNCPRSLQLAITLPGWLRSSVTSGQARCIQMNGCNVSRGKTTPTLHFLCLHGSHAIDAVSIPSSLILLPTVESSLRIRHSSRSIGHGDGRRKAARSERGVEMLEILASALREEPLPCEHLPAPPPQFDYSTRSTGEKGSS